MGFCGRNFIKFLLFPAALVPFLSGCGLLFYLTEPHAHKEVRQAGYELCHIESCGPEALAQVFKKLGIPKDRSQIGREIQDQDHIHYREVLSLVHHDFSRITCPPELLNYCRSQGLTVEKAPYKSLSDKDIAIILMRGRNDITDWHWIEWPNKKDAIETFFGEDTKILCAYRLSFKKA